MFKYFLISIAFVPLLVGVLAAKGADAARSRARLRASWVVYALLWFGALYYLRYRWG